MISSRGVHRLYFARGERLGSTPSLVEWEALPEELKESSREQARDTQGSSLHSASRSRIIEVVDRIPRCLNRQRQVRCDLLRSPLHRLRRLEGEDVERLTNVPPSLP
jgi:hypothetical protein